MAKRTCLDMDETDPMPFPITLEQSGRENFTVTYGKQVDRGLNYSQACAKLGQAILHALACEGRLDNRSKGER